MAGSGASRAACRLRRPDGATQRTHTRTNERCSATRGAPLRSGTVNRLNQQRFDYRTGILASPSEVDAAEWNALLAQQAQPTPFLRHEFLSALHASQSAVADT